MEWLSNGGTVLSVVGGLVGLVGLVGGAAGYFKASRGDSIIKYQTIEIDALRRTAGDHEKEKIAWEADKKALETKCLAKDEIVADQAKQIKFLQKMGQGSPQLKKLAAVQEKLVTSIDNQTKAITALIERESK